MAKPDSAKQVAVHSFLGSGMVYGNAMPVIMQFGRNIPVADRAAVQKRLSVTSSPAQVGAWNWINGHEVHFRPKALWQPGTTLHIAANTGGLAIGDGYYMRNGLTVDASITKHPMSLVDDDATHTLTVRVDGKIVKKIPISMGKASTPSSSGKLVIMTRHPSQIFDSSLGTGGTPVDSPGGYKEKVLWVMQMTWDGQFIHAAPWSVSSQGKRDVSHGCTNVSTANAKWLYENSLVGTPVNVEHTKRPVAANDGWTDWNVSWSTFIKGSALPVDA
jgi:lipoprotein-anchoring transpeptidase ErfK/SrfK